MLQELLIILGITYFGNIFKYFINIPLPGVIIGMITLFILIKTGILKLKYIEKTADIILVNMTIFFLPAMVKLIDYIEVLKSGFFRILFLLIITTIITMIVTSKVVHYMIIWKEGRENGDASGK